MTMMSDLVTPALSIHAPAKVNLFLHVIGKNEAGYHLLQSLFAFTDLKDEISMSPCDDFKFTQESDAFDLPPAENNIILTAAKALAKKLNKPLNCHIHLKKNIPIGAGLGGGSADAAAVIKGLLEFWEVYLPHEKLDDFLLSLGADVPACYHGAPCFVEGIGEIITPVENFEPLHGVLIYPHQACSTAEIFKNYKGEFSKNMPIEKKMDIMLLKDQRNDLTEAALNHLPVIQDCLETLNQYPNCDIARMSGSGSCCFGIFQTEQDAQHAADTIKKEKPDWWVRPVCIS